LLIEGKDNPINIETKARRAPRKQLLSLQLDTKKPIE